MANHNSGYSVGHMILDIVIVIAVGSILFGVFLAPLLIAGHIFASKGKKSNNQFWISRGRTLYIASWIMIALGIIARIYL
ncbi:MAG: hypothetical protein OXF85_03220 [Candidatus Saccharibacteria bacterium]|nr:hypothetical protein [Candidatus Saccharibacteria bacterium]